MVASGWPWMKDATVAIVEKPIAPVNDLDDRPALVDLFSEHRALIDQVATELASDPLYDASKHDDLWILRFLLSHKKNVKAAVKAAKHTLAFRVEHKLDEADIRYTPFGKTFPHEGLQRYLKYCNDDAFQLAVPDPNLGVVCFMDLGNIDQPTMVKNVDEADWLPAFLYVAEWSHQWVDYITRKTGRLTASVRLADMSALSFKGVSSEGKKRDSKALKVTEDCYPQLLKAVFICDGPSFIQVVWRLLRPLFPKRLVEKIDFISPRKNEKERDRLLKYISLESLPTRYGGKNTEWPLNFALPSKLA